MSDLTKRAKVFLSMMEGQELVSWQTQMNLFAEMIEALEAQQWQTIEENMKFRGKYLFGNWDKSSPQYGAVACARIVQESALLDEVIGFTHFKLIEPPQPQGDE